MTLLLSSCGQSGDSIQVNVLTPSGQEAIKTDIQSAMQNNGHKGVYFIIQELQNPVPDMGAVVQGGESLQFPNGDVGLDPTQVRFTIKSGQLDQNKPYVIRMRAFDSNNSETHSGIADCYIDFSDPNRNTVNICFRELGSTDDCFNKGYQTFSQCR